MVEKKYKVTIRDGQDTWTEEYADPKEPDVRKFFQNMVDRRNESIERSYGSSAQHWELVEIMEIASMEETEKKAKKNTCATWSISLDVDCPKCEEYFNILDTPDFWEDRQLDLGEHETARSRGIEVTCPECGYEFTVDLEY